MRKLLKYGSFQPVHFWEKNNISSIVRHGKLIIMEFCAAKRGSRRRKKKTKKTVYVKISKMIETSNERKKNCLDKRFSVGNPFWKHTKTHLNERTNERTNEKSFEREKNQFKSEIIKNCRLSTQKNPFNLWWGSQWRKGTANRFIQMKEKVFWFVFLFRWTLFHFEFDETRVDGALLVTRGSSKWFQFWKLYVRQNQVVLRCRTPCDLCSARFDWKR